MFHIVAATDGSASARAAQAAIQRLPLAEKPAVRLVSVTSLPIPMSELAIEEALLEEARTYQKQEVAHRVAAEAEALQPICDTVTTELRIGDPGTEIVSAAEQSHADLIVLGARGASAVKRFLLGSVSEYVCHHASCPVLVVRTGEPDEAAKQTIPFQRILIAVDGSDLSQAAVRSMAALPLGEGVQVLVLSVQSTINPSHMDIVQTMGGLWSNETRRLKEHVEWAQTELKRVTPNVTTEIVEGAQIAHDILEKAESWHADLVVIGDRARNPISRFFLGSVSNNVLRHAHCSVWVQKLKH
jgi:nucleotide-binding universal stress UspA family protein